MAGCLGDEDPDPADDDDDAAPDPDDDTDPDPDPDEDEDDPYANFPERDVTVIHHGSHGGGYDTYSRLSGRYLTDHLPGDDGDFVVLQMRGGGGRIAMEELYAAEPDGYFIGCVNEDMIPITLIEDVDVEVEEFLVFGNFSVDINSIWTGEWTGITDADDQVQEFADRTADRELTNAITTRTGAVFPAVMGELTGWYSAEDVVDNVVIFDTRADGIRAIADEDVHYSSGSWATLDGWRVEEGGPLKACVVGTSDDESPAPDRTPGAETLGSADVPEAQSIMDLTVDGRTFAGPPGMDDELVEMYRDAYEAVSEDERFQEDLQEAGRPLLWVDGEDMQASFENRIEVWSDHIDMLEAIYG